MSLVRFENVSFSYQGQSILKNISLTLYPQLVTAIMGSSGSGKSTLLNLAVGRLLPCHGTVSLFSEITAQLTLDHKYALWQKVGYLFQSAALFNDMTVLENVRFPLDEHTTLPLSMKNDIATLKLEAVGLRAVSHMHPHELSGGMQRRVALARALALDPCLVCYDEPFAGQDPISMGFLVKLIRQFNDFLKISTLLVSHDIQETLAIADRVIFLDNGRIYFDGTATEFYRSNLPKVVQFVQASSRGPVDFHKPCHQTLKEQLLCR